MVYIQIYARMLVDAISSTFFEVLPFKFRLREMFFFNGLWLYMRMETPSAAGIVLETHFQHSNS